jgi:hypothetical protein
MRGKAVGRLVLGSLILLLAACAQKAETLKLAASQFEAESLATITLLEELRVAEITPPPSTESAETQRFVANALSSGRPATADRVELWRNPDAADTSEANALWATLLKNLNAQYRAFAATFAQLGEGSFFARDTVKETEPVATKLVSQIASFGKAVTDAPPQFLNRRNALLKRLQDLRDGPDGEAQKKAALGAWLDEWRALLRQEADLQQRIVEQSTKASSIGLAVMKQIRAYDQLAASDIADAMGIAFSAAGTLTGKDLTALRSRADGVIEDIQSDPVWKSILDQALAEANAAKDKAKAKDR